MTARKTAFCKPLKGAEQVWSSLNPAPENCYYWPVCQFTGYTYSYTYYWKSSISKNNLFSGMFEKKTIVSAMELPGQKADPFLVFWGNSIPFSTVAALVCIPTNSALGFPFLHILANICCLNLCTPTFIAAQLTLAKCWKQPKCPSVNKWIKKLWYIYTMEYYAGERKKELLTFVTAWVELESIMLSEISQVVRVKYHIISPTSGTESTK